MGIPRTALVNAPRPARGGSGDDAHDPVIATALGACLTVGSSWGWSSTEAASVQCAARHAVRVTRGNGSRVSVLAAATRNAPLGLGTVLQPGGSVCPPLTWWARARDECRPGTSPLFLAGGPQACAVHGVRGGVCLGVHSSGYTWQCARGQQPEAQRAGLGAACANGLGAGGRTGAPGPRCCAGLRWCSSSRISSPGRVLDLKQFGNHPQLSALIREQDLCMLRFMTNLKVQEVTFPSACRRILLFFGKNSYFQNDVLVKEYVVSAAGYRATHSTPIQWSQRYEREAYRRQHQDNGLNFFNWFSDHHLAGSGRIAEIIMDDLWPNVLKYYEREATGGQGASRCRDEYEETAHLSTAIADVQMDTSGQHGSPA
nr:uncharacterized protein LOC112912645 [Vulpes vulpes]